MRGTDTNMEPTTPRRYTVNGHEVSGGIAILVNRLTERARKLEAENKQLNEILDRVESAEDSLIVELKRRIRNLESENDRLSRLAYPDTTGR
jgi:cephalosporin-C deacetylase-like acetyl esterase